MPQQHPKIPGCIRTKSFELELFMSLTNRENLLVKKAAIHTDDNGKILPTLFADDFYDCRTIFLTVLQ